MLSSIAGSDSSPSRWRAAFIACLLHNTHRLAWTHRRQAHAHKHQAQMSPKALSCLLPRSVLSSCFPNLLTVTPLPSLPTTPHTQALGPPPAPIYHGQKGQFVFLLCSRPCTCSQVPELLPSLPCLPSFPSSLPPSLLALSPLPCVILNFYSSHFHLLVHPWERRA